MTKDTVSVEQSVQSIWRKLDDLGLMHPKDLQAMRKGIIECREKMEAIVRKVA